MRLRSACAALAVAGAVLGAPRGAAAQRTDRAGVLSPYEAESLRAALARLSRRIDPSPEGKILEGIDVVPLEVIEDRDPAPSFLNVLHWTTRASVIRREVLLAVGEPYRQYRVDETVRDLQGFQQLSLVLATATVGSAPDRVRLLVVTKDTWSLRSQFEIKAGSGGLDLLRFEPTERNLGGTLDSVLGRIELYPESLTLGGGVYIPRLGGTPLHS